MKIALMKEAYRELFLDMDPLSYLERGYLPGRIVMAATTEDPRTGADIPAGLIVVNREGERLIIEWLCVKERFRTRGIGEALLNAAIRGAASEGRTVMSAYFNKEYGRDIVCPFEEEYFLDHMFETEETLSGEWLDEVRMIKRNLPKEGKADGGMLPLSKIPQAVRQDIEESDAFAYADEDVSVVLTLPDGSYGFLLVQKCDKTLYPVAFQAPDIETGIRLIEACLTAAEEIYGPKTLVRVIKSPKEYVRLLNKLMPDGHFDSGYLSGKISDVTEGIGFTEQYKAATLMSDWDEDEDYE